jgi:hypothetical protein
MLLSGSADCISTVASNFAGMQSCAWAAATVQASVNPDNRARGKSTAEY